MRLLKRFLKQLNSFYKPENVMRINNRSFILNLELETILEKRRNLTYAGYYLGKDRRRFEPSTILLQQLIEEKTTRKVSVDREAAWLFVCGNDLFEERLKTCGKKLRLGDYYLVVFEDRCIGYGLYESSAGIKVLRNLFDIGDFIRREQ